LFADTAFLLHRNLTRNQTAMCTGSVSIAVLQGGVLTGFPASFFTGNPADANSFHPYIIARAALFVTCLVRHCHNFGCMLKCGAEQQTKSVTIYKIPERDVCLPVRKMRAKTLPLKADVSV